MLKKNKVRKSFSLLTLELLIIIFIIISYPRNDINLQAAPIIKAEIKEQIVKSDDLDANIIDEILQEKIEEKKLIKIQKEQEQEKLAKLENEIKTYLGSSISNIGLSYYDINSGKEMVINGDNTFIAGSTIKVQMNMVLSDLFESGQADKNETLKYTDDSYEEGTGILQGTNLSNPFPIMLLSEYSITHSDNIATNMIINKIGYENLRDAVDSKIGNATDHSGNCITANDETKLLKILYEKH